MKQVFFILALVGLVACGSDECCDHTHDIVVKKRHYDCTQDQVDSHPTDSIGRFVSDSVFLNNQAYIDSLTTVSELLDHLETLPSE